MKYGDFSSLVQLGVGLHVGSALLQLYGEIGMQPLVRVIARIRGVVADKAETRPELLDGFDRVETDFEIFRIRLFNEYRYFVGFNSIVAALLLGALVIISYLADVQLPGAVSVFFVSLSVVPAPLILGVLW
jgi:hypothetical protein